MAKDWGIYGDSKREQAQGKRYEKEHDAKPKTVPGRPWREYYSKKELAYRRKKAAGKVDEANYTPSLKSMDKASAYSKATGQKPFARLHAKKDTSYKGFNIKRDKGGKGFSMVIQKKIKGFEEEANMDKIDEAEGIRTVSTKGYHGSKPTKPERRKLTKGFINFKAGKPEGENDQKILDYHKGEAAKEGKVTSLRYRGPRTRGPGAPYIGQSHTTRGAATGAAIYYKKKSELGGRQREAARKRVEDATANEEYDMNEDVEQNEQEEGGEQETMQPDVSDLVLNAIEQRPLDFQQTFADLMQQRIEDAVAEKKLEIAAAFTDDERSQYEVDDSANTETDEEEWDSGPEADDVEQPEAEEESTEEEE